VSNFFLTHRKITIVKAQHQFPKRSTTITKTIKIRPRKRAELIITIAIAVIRRGMWLKIIGR